MDLINKLNLIWQKIGIIQRAMLVTVLLTFVAAAVFVAHWSQKPDLTLLYSNLNPEEAGKITEKIAEQGIAYELKAGGTSVYAPRNKIAELRLMMAREGLPEGSQKGYKIFDDEKIGISPLVQNVNLKRALQDELAKSIQTIDGVEYARVHIVEARQTFLRPDSSETTASVVIKLKAGYILSSANIAAISHLVAGGVSGLKSENVTLVDSNGRLLSSNSDNSLDTGTGSIHDYKDRVEQSLANKAEQMLISVLGPGRASVRVSATINLTSSSTVTERYDPSGKVPIKEEIKTLTEKEGAGDPSSDEQAGGGNEKTDKVILTEFLVGKTIEQKSELAGNIESLAVAAFVDLSSPEPAEGAESAAPAGEMMQIADVETIIRNALGLKESDSLKVVNTRFNRPDEIVVDTAEPKWQLYMDIAKQGSLGLMAICSIIVLKIFTRSPKPGSDAVNSQQLSTSVNQTNLLSAGTGQSEQMMLLRQQITSAMQSNPERAKQLFNSWISQKGA